MKHLAILLLICITFISCKEKHIETATTTSAVKEVSTEVITKELPFKVHSISHATMVLQWGETTIYIDPVGGAEVFANYPQPDLILVTDIHGDHLNVATIEGLDTSKAKIMVPQAVADKMPEAFVPQLDVLNNGDSKERFGFSVEAIPMYNLREEALKFHTKGRGNGYVIEKEGTRVYISGDTEDIPEMRALTNIDAAFVCMNLPYTMTEVSAADAVIAFAPKTIYPYHYRGTGGLSDVANFKNLVNKGNPAINVIQLDWYAKK
ncbi:MBL fold metallo-hydrolase [uncultured Dokdonia sp.]|uniref:MBL fold metallo-hydrolase n=1 Tax=uncultured Dokdonia sp. TaxID=575653 RepID=UPI00260FA8B9|nr:MBL fold metallo-hydrolase [uncultured Dokdonia sp.]